MNPVEAELLQEQRKQRDTGIARVQAKNSAWLLKALTWLPAMKAAGHKEVTGEEIRVFITSNGVDQPTNPHAWGMLIRMAMKRGILADTGRQKQMWTEKSHARRTPVWRLA